MSARPNRPIKVFISYAHEDSKAREKLDEHFSALKREGLVDIWHDRRIVPGDEWAGKIDENLDAAGLILLLVSSSFMASRYCYDVEVSRAMQRHEAGKARVVPIMLEHVDIGEDCPWKKLQLLPSEAKPVNEWKPQSKAYLDIANGMRTAIRELRQPRKDDGWYDQLRKAAYRSLVEQLQPEERKPIRRALYRILGVTEPSERTVNKLCRKLCDPKVDPDLAGNLLGYHKQLRDQRSSHAKAVETIFDTILPVHFDVGVLRKAFKQRRDDGRPLLEKLVATDFGAELLMAAFAGRCVALCPLPPRESESKVTRIGSPYQHDYDRPAPGRLASGPAFQQELHDTLHQMARPLADDSQLRRLKRLKSTEVAEGINVCTEVLRHHVKERETVHGRTPFWVFMARQDESREARSRRERIFQEIANRVGKIAFFELSEDDNAGEQERVLVRLLQTRFQDTKES